MRTRPGTRPLAFHPGWGIDLARAVVVGPACPNSTPVLNARHPRPPGGAIVTFHWCFRWAFHAMMEAPHFVTWLVHVYFRARIRTLRPGRTPGRYSRGVQRGLVRAGA